MFHIIPPLKVEGTGPWIGKGVRASAMEEDSDCLWGWLQWRSCKPNEMGPVVAEAEEALRLFILDMTEPRTCLFTRWANSTAPRKRWTMLFAFRKMLP